MVSTTGSITVNEHTEVAYLDARRGSVRVSDIFNSFVIAEQVVIDGDAINCTIVANKVTIKGTANGCKIISGASVSVRKSIEKGDENIFNLFSLDLSASIEKKKASIQTLEEALRIVEEEIDVLIFTKFPSINTSMSDKRKRLRICRTLIEMMRFPNTRSSAENIKYAKLFDFMKATLEETRKFWEKLCHYDEALKKLNDELQAEVAIAEGVEQTRSIEIKNIE